MLSVKNLSLSVDGLRILHHLSFDIKEGSIIGLIGPNGAGKSTVFNVVCGFIPFAEGSLMLGKEELMGLSPDQVSRLGLTRTFQDSLALKQISVLENLIVFSPELRGMTLSQIFFQPFEVRRKRRQAIEKAKELLKKVGLEQKKDALAKDLSYGQIKLLEMLKVFMSEARLIFLDEPFSGLYPEMVKIITQLMYDLASQGNTIVFVEHTMKLIEEICDQVIVLDSGEKIAEGTFEEIRKNKAVMDAYLGN